MSDSPPEIVIVRRVEEHDEEHGSSVWKIALADFMTAMMAFFLIMWLLSASDKQTRGAIAAYFNPIDLVTSRSNTKGLEDVSITTVPQPDPAKPGDKGGQQTGGSESQPAASAQTKDEAAFRDPYRVLAEIAAQAPPLAVQPASQKTAADLGPLGRAPLDPFDPAHWTAASSNAVADQTRKPVRTPAAAVATDAHADPAKTDVRPQHPKQPAAGQRKDTEKAVERAIADVARAAAANGGAADLTVSKVPEGLLISVTDDAAFSMFAVGSAVPKPETVRLMEQVAAVLKTRPERIVIRGHTDGRPFHSGDYDNWRLSTARAEMARYMLVRGGVEEARIARIEGYADRDPKVPSDPLAAANRRIDILLLRPSNAEIAP